MTRKRSARTLASGVCVILFFAFQAGTELPARQDGAAPPGATRTLRLATLAPEGTEWADAARDAARRIREETGGRVELQWNLGAVMGDEASMMTRMREGTLEGGVFSMVGLTREVPPMVFMGLPFLFRDGKEAREIFRRFAPVFQERFLEKELILLGSFSLGFGRLFTVEEAGDLEQLAALRTWTWKGDSLGGTVFRALGFRNLVPLEMTDVLPALQYQLLDAFSGTCYTISVLQWFPYAKYVVPLNWAYTFGGIVVRVDAFKGISPRDRDLFRRVISELVRRMETESREKEKEAARILSTMEGMRETRLSGEDVSRLERRARKVHGTVAGDIQEEELLESILQALGSLRGETRKEPRASAAGLDAGRQTVECGTGQEGK